MSLMLDAAPPGADLGLKTVFAWARKATDLQASELVRNAAGLLSESLVMQRYAVAEIGSAQEMRLRLYRTQAHVNAGRPMAERVYRRGGPLSLAGYAANQAEVVAFSDLAVESRFRDAFLVEHGLVSALACPIVIDGQLHAVLVALDETPRLFTPEEINFAEAITQLVTITASREAARTALVEERRLSRAVIEQSPMLVLVLDADGNIRRVNRAFEKQTGYAGKDLKSCKLDGGLFDPSDFEKLLAGEDEIELDAVITSRGGKRRATRWSCSTIDEDGEPMKVLTGVVVDEPRAKTGAAKKKTQQKEGAAPKAEPAVDAFALMPAGANDERRERPRRCYPYVQLIAYQDGGTLPSPEEFYEVQCRDISGGGFSYYSAERPTRDLLVVALGSRPNLTYLTATVAHHAKVRHEGRPMYLVGCQYTDRASY